MTSSLRSSAKQRTLVGQFSSAVIYPVEDLSLRVLGLRQDRLAINLQRRLKPGARAVCSVDRLEFCGHLNS